MATRQISWANFHDSTAGSFSRCERPDRAADFESGSGSRYWNEGDAVVRESDHWNHHIRSCGWLLDGECYSGEAVCGRATYAALAEGAAARHAAWVASIEEGENRRAEQAALRQPGQRVKIDREVCERVTSRHFRRVQETVVCTIAKLTAQFLVTTEGARYKLSTIKSLVAAEGGAA